MPDSKEGNGQKLVALLRGMVWSRYWIGEIADFGFYKLVAIVIGVGHAPTNDCSRAAVLINICPLYPESG